MDPKVGDVLIVDRRASVQFSGVNSLILRVISVSDGATYDGWAWVAGYVIDRRRVRQPCVERSSCFVAACDSPHPARY